MTRRWKIVDGAIARRPLPVVLLGLGRNNIDPGTTKSFQATLPPGRDVLVGNLPGRYVLGMHTGFTVTS